MEYFKQEFLSMDVSDKMSEIVAAHLAQDRISGLMGSTPETVVKTPDYI
ncbi:MAG: hypothetical protein IPO62_00025 [Saprospiraceae bacterium]|nr:hypothetical protein [Saprospiraceae bacterium]